LHFAQPVNGLPVIPGRVLQPGQVPAQFLEDQFVVLLRLRGWLRYFSRPTARDSGRGPDRSCPRGKCGPARTGFRRCRDCSAVPRAGRPRPDPDGGGVRAKIGADGVGLDFLRVKVGGEPEPREDFALVVVRQVRVLHDAKMPAKGVNPVFGSPMKSSFFSSSSVSLRPWLAEMISFCSAAPRSKWRDNNRCGNTHRPS